MSKRLVTPSMLRSSTTYVVANTQAFSHCAAPALQTVTIRRQQARYGDVRCWSTGFSTFGGQGGGRELRALRLENGAKQHPSESRTRANRHFGHRLAPSARSAPEVR